jgi:GNAT superfamily N-acetyltransferase
VSTKVIRFAPGLRPVIKHQEHDQSSHGSWANSSERSAKEIEVQQRITQIEHKSYPTDEDGMSSNRVTAIYETKDGTKIKLLHDNEKTSDGDISMTTKAYLFVDGGVKEIADLESSRANNVVPEAGAIIDRIQVQPEYKRQGIATAMLNFARSYSQDGIKIEHSFSLTDDAKGWSGVVKHQQGLHDQRTHGSWAGGGGAGVDISEALDEVFFTRKLDIKESKIFPGSLRIPTEAEITRAGHNKETVDLIEKMSEAQVASGQAYGDNALKIIAERQGFTGKPKTVKTLSDLEEMQSKNGGILVYRGIANYSAEKTEKVTYSAEQALTDFREGEYFGGWGVFGNGTYATSNYNEADTYKNFFDIENGKVGKGKMMAMLIPKGAKAPSEAVVKSVVKNMVYGGEATHRNDVGRRLASMGYQYYDASFVQNDKVGTYVILDRSMLTVAEKEVKL